jgi:hypothetical protein
MDDVLETPEERDGGAAGRVPPAPDPVVAGGTGISTR